MFAADRFLFELAFSLAGAYPLGDAAIVFFAKYASYGVVLAFFAFLLILRDGWREKVRFFGFAALSVILARGVLTPAIRFFLPTVRPHEALSIETLLHSNASSFPSGHAAFFFALGAAVFLYHRRVGSLFFLAAFLVGFARVAAGIHWPVDIIGGAFVGIVSAFIVRALIKPYPVKITEPAP